jgi:hypothetical protein
MSSLILADKLLDNKISSENDLNATQITEFINWFSKTTERMNKVAKLLENK